jgi:hypothetical protein
MNKSRAIRHLNRHYSRGNTIARDTIGSIGFGFILAIVAVTGIIIVLGNIEAIERFFVEVLKWIVI